MSKEVTTTTKETISQFEYLDCAVPVPKNVTRYSCPSPTEIMTVRVTPVDLAEDDKCNDNLPEPIEARDNELSYAEVSFNFISIKIYKYVFFLINYGLMI